MQDGLPQGLPAHGDDESPTGDTALPLAVLLGIYIPQAMRKRAQWLQWRMVRKAGQDKPSKLPFYFNGAPRGWPKGQPKGPDGRVLRDPETKRVMPTLDHPQVDQGHELDRWALGSFDEAMAAMASGRCDGGGFAFLPGDGLIGIDIDHAIDRETGEVSEQCQAIITQCASYTELSPSGTGVHIIVEGECKTFKDNTVGVEVFCGRQFFTVTARPWAGSEREVMPIGPETLAWLHGLVKGPAAEAAASAAVQAPAQAAAPAGQVRAGLTADAAERARRSASRYCMAALDGAVQDMRGAGSGMRNKTLNRAAFGLGQLVHTGQISETVIRAALSEAARSAGLADAEIGPTLDSGLRSGMDKPRQLPERELPPQRNGGRVIPIERAANWRGDELPPEPPDEDPPPGWLAAGDVVEEAAETSPPPSGKRAAAGPRAKAGGKGAASRVSARELGGGSSGDDAELPLWVQERITAMAARYSLVYGSDTAWDNVELMLVRVPTLRLSMGTVPTKVWLTKIAKGEARTVRPTDLVFEPGGRTTAQQINMFAGLDVEPVPCTGEEVAPMLELLRHLCSDTAVSADEVDKAMEWVLRWQAYPLQNIGAKMQTAIVMHGAQGTGKNLYWDVWRDLYGQYGITVTQTEIEDKFNGWVSRKLAIIGDEVVSKQEMYHNKNRLKLVVTQEKKFAIRGMQMETRWESNHANVVFLSNESMPLALEERDRRYQVIYTPLEADTALYERVRDFLAHGGAAKWLHYLQTYPLDGFDEHTKPLMTQAKTALIELNWQAPERFANEWLSGFLDLPVQVCSNDQLYKAFRRWCDRDGERWPPPKGMFTSKVKRWVNERRKRDDKTGRFEAPALISKTVALDGEMGHRRAARCWLPDGCGLPDGSAQTEGQWAYASVTEFERSLYKFCRHPGQLDDQDQTS